MALDLFVAQLLGGTEEAVAGVGDDHVDAPEVGEGLVGGASHLRGVGDVQRARPQPPTVAAGELVQARGVTQGGGDRCRRGRAAAR